MTFPELKPKWVSAESRPEGDHQEVFKAEEVRVWAKTLASNVFCMRVEAGQETQECRISIPNRTMWCSPCLTRNELFRVANEK